MRWRILTAVVLTMSLGRPVAVQERFDGEFWSEASALSGETAKSAKLMFALGLLTGLRTASSLIVASDASGKGLSLMQGYISKHLLSMPTSQVVAGLDSFYADYANRRILVQDAAAVVLRRIAGDDDSSVASWVKLLREKASKDQ